MDIKITINGIEQFTEAVALLASAIAYDKGVRRTGNAAQAIAADVSQVPGPAPIVEKSAKVEAPIAEVEVEKPKDKAPVADGPPIPTLEEVRAAFMDKNSKPNAPKLKKILADHGVKKVTDLEEKDFLSVLNALGTI